MALAAALVLADPTAAMLSRGLAAKNYRGELIPTGMGLVFLMAVLAGLGALVLLGRLDREPALAIAFWLTMVCLAGLVDDAAGDGSSRGLRGHFAALLGGRLTTGIAKIILIGGGALVAVDWNSGWRALVQAAILALAVNLLNQLDLRPGRALKFFLCIAAVVALRGNALAAVGCGAAAGLLKGDLEARYMLGDAGANLLGAVLGLAAVQTVSPGAGQALLMLALAAGNALGEFSSYSRLIAASPILQWFDKIGRQAGK